MYGWLNYMVSRWCIVLICLWWLCGYMKIEFMVYVWIMSFVLRMLMMHIVIWWKCALHELSNDILQTALSFAPTLCYVMDYCICIMHVFVCASCHETTITCVTWLRWHCFDNCCRLVRFSYEAKWFATKVQTIHEDEWSWIPIVWLLEDECRCLKMTWKYVLSQHRVMVRLWSTVWQKKSTINQKSTICQT